MKRTISPSDFVFIFSLIVYLGVVVVSFSHGNLCGKDESDGQCIREWLGFFVSLGGTICIGIISFLVYKIEGNRDFIEQKNAERIYYQSIGNKIVFMSSLSLYLDDLVKGNNSPKVFSEKANDISKELQEMNKVIENSTYKSIIIDPDPDIMKLYEVASEFIYFSSILEGWTLLGNQDKILLRLCELAEQIRNMIKDIHFKVDKLSKSMKILGIYSFKSPYRRS